MTANINRDPKFQSTLPAKGATSVQRNGPCIYVVSIHAPGKGSDWRSSAAKI